MFEKPKKPQSETESTDGTVEKTRVEQEQDLRDAVARFKASRK